VHHSPPGQQGQQGRPVTVTAAPEDGTTCDPPAPKLPIPRWVAWLCALCAIVLVPWVGYLAYVLPQRARAEHYDIAWVGFDAGMCVVLAALAWCAAKRRPATGALAAVAATFLVLDAWFDVTTSSGRTRFLWALASAVLIELPLAALCTWVAVNAERLRSRAYRRLWQQAERTRQLRR
jgi:hypothetical protein